MYSFKKMLDTQIFAFHFTCGVCGHCTGITCFRLYLTVHRHQATLPLVSRVSGDTVFVFSSSGETGLESCGHITYQCEYFLCIRCCSGGVSNHGKRLILLWPDSGIKSTDR